MLNSFLESLSSVPPSSNTQFVCTKENDGDIMFVDIIKKYDDSIEEELEEDEGAVTRELGIEYCDRFPTRRELAYRKDSEVLSGTDEIDYKMPHKIEKFNSLSDLKKEHTKSVYFRNEGDKRRGVDYVMNKIWGINKECLELVPEYLTRLERCEVSDEGGVTDYSRPSHEGYQNTIELLDGNNAVPLISDIIRLVQNGCSFYGLLSDDPNQYLKNRKDRGSVDDDGKPLEKVDYMGDQGSENEAGYVNNEMASYLALKPSGLYMKIPNNIQSIRNNLDIKAQAKGRWSGNSVKEKGLSMDDGHDVGNGGEAFGFITSNVASNGMDVHIPKESVSVLNERFNNIVYEFFQDMHFFKFGSKEGIEAMLESSSWLIHNVPLILKQWTSDANIIKADVWNILVSVKFHDVPITAFTEDQLSAIASKLDSPLMLDSYTAAMCTDS
nr:hypothetical protein [Tanacetum cinerariifolium]